MLAMMQQHRLPLLRRQPAQRPDKRRVFVHRPPRVDQRLALPRLILIPPRLLHRMPIKPPICRAVIPPPRQHVNRAAENGINQPRRKGRIAAERVSHPMHERVVTVEQINQSGFVVLAGVGEEVGGHGGNHTGTADYIGYSAAPDGRVAAGTKLKFGMLSKSSRLTVVQM